MKGAIMPTKETAPAPEGRRSAERRQTITAKLPFADRRKGERRSGGDRRSQPRAH